MIVNENLKKRLIYQSQHRGMKEMDLALGRFVKQHIHEMNEEEVLQLEWLLSFPDHVIYGWFFQNDPLPEGAPQKLVQKILLALEQK